MEYHHNLDDDFEDEEIDDESLDFFDSEVAADPGAMDSDAPEDEEDDEDLEGEEDYPAPPLWPGGAAEESEEMF
jgi:hypothetical protein